MSSIISKNTIVSIVQDLKSSDVHVQHAVTSFYNLINSEMTRASKQETTFGWELLPIRVNPIITVDKDQSPIIGIEIVIGFNSSIMGEEYIELFTIMNKNKFRQDAPCEFQANVCYDLLSDPVKPSNLEDLTMFMKQYFKEQRRAIENIWIDQVLGTMKMALGHGDEQDESAKVPTRIPHLPQQSQPQVPHQQMISSTRNGKASFDMLDELDVPPVQMADPKDQIPLPALRSPVSPMQLMPGASSLPPITVKKNEKAKAKGKNGGSGGILRRGKSTKAQDMEFDISAKEDAVAPKADERPPRDIPAVPKQSSEKIITDDDEDSPPPIPKIPVLDSSKLKHH